MRRYVESDYQQIKSWLIKRDRSYPQADNLPTIGLIVDDVACGFLIKTDTKTAIMEYFISNPDASIFKINEAIDLIILGLTELAEDNGFKYIKCDSNLRSIQRKALKNGFIPIGNYHNFIKEVTYG